MLNSEAKNNIFLLPVDERNWRKVIRLKVKPSQIDYVAETSYYLLLCHYGELWQPLAVVLDQQVIGFIMWAIDQNDGSCWLGGFHIDSNWQGMGYGRQTMQTIIKMISQQYGINKFAISIQPINPAREFYKLLGFTETDEWEDDEIVMRFSMK
jgi:diamine N-acetyltransferase